MEGGILPRATAHTTPSVNPPTAFYTPPTPRTPLNSPHTAAPSLTGRTRPPTVNPRYAARPPGARRAGAASHARRRDPHRPPTPGRRAGLTRTRAAPTHAQGGRVVRRRRPCCTTEGRAPRRTLTAGREALRREREEAQNQENLARGKAPLHSPRPLGSSRHSRTPLSATSYTSDENVTETALI